MYNYIPTFITLLWLFKNPFNLPLFCRHQKKTYKTICLLNKIALNRILAVCFFAISRYFPIFQSLVFHFQKVNNFYYHAHLIYLFLLLLVHYLLQVHTRQFFLQILYYYQLLSPIILSCIIGTALYFVTPYIKEDTIILSLIIKTLVCLVLWTIYIQYSKEYNIFAKVKSILNKRKK